MPVKFKRCAGRCGRSLPLGAYWNDSKQRDGKMTRCIDCVQERREEIKAKRAAGEEVPTISAELREERRERALQLHAEGRLGGRQFALMRGDRKKRVTDVALDWARDHPELIVAGLQANLRSRSKSDRMKAIQFLTGLELEDQKVQQAARGAGKSPEEMTDAELQEFVVQALAARVQQGDIDLTGIIDLPPEAVREVA